MRLHKDVIVALVLLALCGVFFQQTFVIKDMGYDTIGAEVWPRLILLVLTVLSGLYLAQSLRQPAQAAGPWSIGAWLGQYRNALWCYGLFALFLLTMPWLGMLIGGVLFVFLALTVMGERTPRAIAIHLVVALATIGVMWAIFTFGLRVILPEGEILRIW